MQHPHTLIHTFINTHSYPLTHSYTHIPTHRYGYSRLLHACCADDVSTKVRDWVFCEHEALLLLGRGLGDAVEAAAQSGAQVRNSQVFILVHLY